MNRFTLSRRGRGKNYEPEQTNAVMPTVKLIPDGIIEVTFFLCRLSDGNSFLGPRAAPPCRHAGATDSHEPQAQKQMGRSLGRTRERYPYVLKCHGRRWSRGKERVEVPNSVLGHEGLSASPKRTVCVCLLGLWRGLYQYA